ncbi:unnamed protein product [Parnassius apollo]|uniref:(apollo) hypothetical protein n=1 Tax=Parnassius apollo TaxID=110799 RepID=A0A8S3Y4L5_PARAO|nr:unnamed protein product [Parnassius apollo]
MAVEGGLNDEEIRLIVNQESSDEEDLVFRGSVTEDSDDEPDGVLEDFRHMNVIGQTNNEEYAFSSDDDMTLQELSQDLRRQGKLKVLNIPRVLYRKGKNNRYKWSGEKPVRRRTQQRNIIMHLSGNKGEAKSITKPIEGWALFVNDEILNKIAYHTNK